jgi:ribulose-5-phosphate 4-epimerase/fuculose-1-phosphate aldolase
MLTIDLDGNVLNDSKYKPSSETPFHTAIYRNRPDINAVIHTHTINTTILTLTNLDFLPITAETAGIGRIPTIDWTSGTAESGQQVVNALGKNGYFVQIQNHGLVVAGPSLQWAAGITDMIEIQCKILVTCKMMGMTPKVLPKEIVEAIQNAQKKGQSIG